MVISDSIFAMLLTEPYFKTYTKKTVSDAKASTEVLIALDAQSKEEVQETVAKAKKAGAVIYSEPQDHGWMYLHSFADPDGHQWELIYMDQTKLPNQE
jgi:predicted lactoylglutathione lyase